MADSTGKVSAHRSRLMSRVRGKNTSPELVVRKMLHRRGLRYRLHSKKLPGSPDVVFPSRRKVIFVHGCFWHRHKGCKRTTTPKTRTEFWSRKFADNQRRDKRVLQEMERIGWRSKVVWECETSRDDLTELEENLIKFVGEIAVMQPKKIPNWTIDELILALELYLKFVPQFPTKTDASISELSRLLRSMDRQTAATFPRFRSPGSVYAKLGNFRRLDERRRAGGELGLPHGSRLDEYVWNEFHTNIAELKTRANKIRSRVLAGLR